MPGVIVPFPAAHGSGFALMRVGKKRTVRFVARPRRAVEPAATHCSQRDIDGARINATNYRRLADKTTDRTWRQKMLDLATKWDERAAKLEAAKHGPQMPPDGLFKRQ